MKWPLRLLCLVLVCGRAFAQPSQQQLDLSFGAGKAFKTLNFSWNNFYPLGSKARLHLGWGLRFNNSFSGPQTYLTAPAVLNSTQAGPLTIFSPDVPANIDTLRLGSLVAYNLNLAFNARYLLTEKWLVGVNIDVVGFSWGGYQTGTISLNQTAGGAQYPARAKPTTLNLLLTSNNDNGSLNSEFYAGYRLTNSWSLRAGYSLYFVEYQTQARYRFENDRFRHKAGLGFVALAYHLR